MCSVSQKSWSSCWAVDHEAHDQLDKSFNNPEGARCQQKAQIESVSDAAQLQKEDPSVAQLVAAQNDDVISANKRKFARS